MSNVICLKGRKKIYTDVDVITKDNVCDVLRKAMTTHEINRASIEFLLNFDKGLQPLVREKTVRPEINIESIANVANEITEFKLGYFWGNPIALVQKSDKLPVGSDKTVDNSAIAILNDFYYAEQKDSKDQELARYIEICGVGYQMIDIKRNPQDGDSPFDLVTLNPMYTFVVYSSDIYHRPVMGVTYTIKEDYSKTFTCITEDSVFIIDSNWKIKNGAKKTKELSYLHQERSGELNPLGEVYIIEFERSFDRMGCFERQIDELNALNVLTSDLVNDVAQNTQAIWWGNDFKFDEDESGEVKTPVSGQWVMTNTTGNGIKPDVKALVLQFDYSGIIQNISTQHDYILERAFVPKQSDPGGGSTGTAMSLSSGWSAAESVACKEALVLKRSFQIRNRLALKAVKKSTIIAEDSPVQSLSANDVEIRFIRQKTFDLSTKANSLKVLLDSMVDPRTAMTTVDLFGNLAEAVDDSYDNMKKYQENILESGSKTDTGSLDSNRNDLSAQAENSPILDN